VRFTGRNYVLPRTGQEGIPLVTVNSAQAEIDVYRVGDRNLLPTLRSDEFLAQMGRSSALALGREKGFKIWSGTLETKSELNKDLTTAFPVMEDIDFCVRAHLAGYELVYVPEAVYHYRFRGDLEGIWRQAYRYNYYRALLRRRHGAEPLLTPRPWMQLCGRALKLGRVRAKVALRAGLGQKSWLSSGGCAVASSRRRARRLRSFRSTRPVSVCCSSRSASSMPWSTSCERNAESPPISETIVRSVREATIGSGTPSTQTRVRAPWPRSLPASGSSA
jgi:hypothetical protein